MKNKFSEYYKASEKELLEHWKNDIFRFDANVLFNLYRYIPKTRDAFFNLFEKLKNRIWISYQAAIEYLKNRLIVIKDQKKAHNDIRQTLLKKKGEIEAKLNSFKKHPYLQRMMIMSIRNDLSKRGGLIFIAISYILFVTTVFAQNLNPPYPRIGQVTFYSPGAGPTIWKDHDFIAIRNHLGSDARAIKEKNPDVLLFGASAVVAGEEMESVVGEQFPEEWFAHWADGSKIPLWAGYLMNMTDYCPSANFIYGQQKFYEFLASYFKENTDWNYFDGLFFDGWIANIQWFSYKYGDIDFDYDGVADGDSATYNRWNEANILAVEEVRRLVDKLILAHESGESYFNGNAFEFWTQATASSRSGNFNKAIRLATECVAPQIIYANSNAEGSGAVFRCDFTSAQIVGAFFGHDEGSFAHRWTYLHDEYMANLGYPIGPHEILGTGVFVRYFDNGALITNISGEAKTVTSSHLTGGPYYRFRGQQAPDFNDGSEFSSVDFESFDGILLLNQPTTIITPIIIDNIEINMTSIGQNPAEYTGSWTQTTNAKYSYALAFGWGEYSEFHAQASAGNGDAVAIYEPNINVAGNYEIFEWHGQAGRNDEDFQEATNVPYFIIKDGSTITSGHINQALNVGQWNSLGTFKFPKGKRIVVKLTNDADGVVISDAIRFVYMESDSGDNVPPNAPRSLNSTNQTDESITLSWSAPLQASDGDIASSYDIYRNNIYVGLTNSTVFTDTSLTINTTYSYEVYAVDESENMSLAPATGTFSTTNNAIVYSLNLSVVPDNIGKIQYYPIKESYYSNETVVLSAIPSKINGKYNGNIYIESETGSLSGNFGVQKSQIDPEVFYLFGTHGIPMDGAAEYTFEIQEAGIYVIWGRCYSFNQYMDSFFMEVDSSGNVIAWHLEKDYDKWIWQKVTENGAVKFFYFTAGIHTLKIIKRDIDARIDKVIITKDMSFTPSGKEDALILEKVCQFDNWSGSLTGSSNPAEIVMNEDKNISAQFETTLIVTTPYTPNGFNSGYVGERINFNTGGSICSNGDDVEYQFDWGNGELSDWNTGSLYYTYTNPGTFNIKARARSQQHTDITSNWSSNLQIDISVSENTMYNVSGNVVYENSNLPIQNVSLTISGDIAGTKTTTADGIYTLLVDSGKSIIMTPDKAKGEDIASLVITTYDAALTAQHAIGMIQLGNNQQIAADADQGGTVNTFDAALIAQYSVGIQQMNISAVGEWRFLPSSLNINEINSNLTEENFTALIVGNSDGNWSQPGFYKRDIISITNLKEKIKVERISDNFIIQIYVEQEQQVISADIEINFENKNIDFIECKTSTLSSAFQVIQNVAQNKLRIGMYSTEPINESGELISLVFTQNSETNHFKPFLLTSLIINDFFMVNETSPFELRVPTNEIFKPELLQNHPNPFNNKTTIKYRTQKNGFGEIAIYNIFGQKIKTLISGHLSKGYHTATWDGKDKSGNTVASGVYFYQLRLEGFVSVRKLLMIE